MYMYMRKIVLYSATLLLLFVFVSCENKKRVNPLWGLWVQIEPKTASKAEVMFNEDFTGFVFNADTLVCETRWKQNDMLKVTYLPAVATTGGSQYERAFDCMLAVDTLVLVDNASSASTRYLRVRE